jgi:magnesium chelatase family protein
LDRIDIRVPCNPVDPDKIFNLNEEPSEVIRERVRKAVERQEARFDGRPFTRNNRLPPGLLTSFCTLDHRSRALFTSAIRKLSLSSRACHSILKLSRTIADLAASEQIEEDHLLEAIQHRRYGDHDYFFG